MDLAEETDRQNVEGTNLLPCTYDNILEKIDAILKIYLLLVF